MDGGHAFDAGGPVRILNVLRIVLSPNTAGLELIGIGEFVVPALECAGDISVKLPHRFAECQHVPHTLLIIEFAQRQNWIIRIPRVIIAAE